MTRPTNAQLGGALRCHYATQRQEPTREELTGLVSAMLAADAEPRVLQYDLSMYDFIAAQVHYVSIWAWAAQLAIVLLMALVALGQDNSEYVRITMSLLAGASVLVGVPSIQSSKQHGVAELEYSCKYNAVSIVIARLIIFGCTSALAVAVMVFTCATRYNLSVLAVALWVCPPYFCSCAGALALMRRMTPRNAVLASSAWVAVCFVVLLALSLTFPDLYEQASLAVWGMASCAGFVWLVRELVLTVREAAAGLDAFCPYAQTSFSQ